MDRRTHRGAVRAPFRGAVSLTNWAARNADWLDGAWRCHTGDTSRAGITGLTPKALLNVTYYLMTSEASDERRREFDVKIGLAGQAVIKDPRLPEQMQDKTEPDWIRNTNRSVNAASWAASLGP